METASVRSLAIGRSLWHKADIGSRYSKRGGESAGVEHELARHDELDLARSIYRQMVANYPAWFVMLCDRARVLARSDLNPFGRRGLKPCLRLKWAGYFLLNSNGGNHQS